MPVHLRVVAFNDVYSLENLPRFKSLVDQARSEGDHFLVTLAGDFLAPSVLSSLDSGRAMVECLNAIGVTHLVFGNHEDDVPLVELRKRVAELKGVTLGTNIREFSPALAPHDIVALGPEGALRVGIIGVVLKDPLVYRHKPFGATLLDANESAISEAAHLRRDLGCQYVIALTHQSDQDDEALAEAQKGLIPLILGGHDHPVFDKVVAGCQILKAGSEAQHAVLVDLVWTDEKAPPTLTTALLDVRDYPEDFPLRELIEQRMRPVRALQAATMLELGPDEKLSSVGARKAQTTMGSLICNHIRDVLGADACIFNGGGIRGSCDYTTRFTYGDLEAELPFDNRVVIVRMPGSALDTSVRFSRARAPAEYGGFLQVDDGVVFDAHTGGITQIGGRPFDPLHTYRVAMVRNLLFGLDDIEPLVRFASEAREAVPAGDVGLTPKQLIVRAFADALWKELGGFPGIDADHNGVVTKEELRAALSRARHGEPSELLAEIVVGALDADHNQLVSQEDIATKPE